MATIVFDFDGTIADSFDYVIDFLSERSKNKPKLSASDRKKLRGLSMIALACLLGHHRHQLAGLFLRGRKDMRAGMNKVKPIKGMPEVISSLAADGHKLFIVSNNSADNVEQFLKKHKIHHHFTGIHGNAWMLGKHRALARLARRSKTDDWDVHYIGDEPGDIKAANYLSAKSIGVTWGFCSRAKIEANEPTAVADRPGELLALIDEA
ncbi:MAG TPA: HAD hydrolase-like protein [Candidatus Saccharimonadales bacterium]|nr:HAD hydrolase-like protein [Candidatus Saccharimonadales bacterium]